MNIELKILNKEFYSPNNLPKYSTNGSAALDLICTETVYIPAQGVVNIKTGLSIHIGSHNDTALRSYREHWDYAGVIVPRSGLGTRGIVLANLVGLIDSDYQGEIVVAAWNRLPIAYPMSHYLSDNSLIINKGDRFAQMFIMPIAKAQWSVVAEFSTKTERNTGSFGSTGV